MNQDTKTILVRHLELDAFYTGDFSVRAPRPAPAAAGQPLLSSEETPMKTPSATTESYATLDEIADVVCQCQKCGLGATRTHAVPGQGCAAARLVFIGEGPGADEDAQGLAFVGRAGKLLTDIITAMGLKREDVFIGNIIKCRPPGNRDPKPDEVRACSPYLKRQLELIAPQVIVALGAHAARTLLQTEEGIGKLRGQFFAYRFSDTCPPAKLMPTYHPAFLLRSYTPENRRRVWDDMQKVMHALGLTPPGKSASD